MYAGRRWEASILCSLYLLYYYTVPSLLLTRMPYLIFRTLVGGEHLSCSLYLALLALHLTKVQTLTLNVYIYVCRTLLGERLRMSLASANSTHMLH